MSSFLQFSLESTADEDLATVRNWMSLHADGCDLERPSETSDHFEDAEDCESCLDEEDRLGDEDGASVCSAPKFIYDSSDDQPRAKRAPRRPSPPSESVTESDTDSEEERQRDIRMRLDLMRRFGGEAPPVGWLLSNNPGSSTHPPVATPVLSLPGDENVPLSSSAATVSTGDTTSTPVTVESQPEEDVDDDKDTPWEFALMVGPDPPVPEDNDLVGERDKGGGVPIFKGESGTFRD